MYREWTTDQLIIGSNPAVSMLSIHYSSSMPRYVSMHLLEERLGRLSLESKLKISGC